MKIVKWVLPLVFIGCVLFSVFLFRNHLLIKTSSDNERKLAIYSVETDTKKIAISFDDGWGISQTEEILDVLDEHQVKATFFLVGAWIETYPEDVIKIAERGHDLGNHTDTHALLTKMTKEEIQQEIMRVHEKVKALTGKRMVLFRPPYGAYNNTVIEAADACYYYSIKWDVDSLDWKNDSVSKIIQNVLDSKSLKNGSIILFHNNTKYTKEAVDVIITRLKEEGFEIVPISKLIYKDHYHLDATGRQIKDEIR